MASDLFDVEGSRMEIWKPEREKDNLPCSIT